MNIKINQELVDQAINQNINDAICKALKSYEIEKAITDRVSNSIASGVIAESVDKAITQMDADALTNALAEQIQRTAIASTVSIIRDGFVDTIMKLRGVSEYDEAKRAKARAEISAELDAFRK